MGSIDLAIDQNVAIITLVNPARRNAVDAPMRAGLTAAYDRIEQDDDIHVAVIRGEGETFCAGGDINGYQEANSFGPEGAGPPAIPRPWPAQKPYIAAIQGYAVGGGFALAVTCDLRIIGRGAQIGPSGLKRGAVQGAGQSQRLPRLIGASKALELLLLSKYVTGEEAAAMGLANTVVDDDQVIDTALEWAHTIAAHSPWAVAQTKKLTWAAFDRGLDDGLAVEAEIALAGYRTPEAQAGFAAFLDAGKRS
ncbi:enoyl-CoA hydratase/isomerase family protein [Rhodococcus sp. WS4]|nr:enoyl-CoA hydratase/isomerase family protein [Rhodococcus sp. WS4]